MLVNVPAEGIGVGKTTSGMSKISSRSGSHVRSWMFSSIVRDALVTSVR